MCPEYICRLTRGGREVNDQLAMQATFRFQTSEDRHLRRIAFPCGERLEEAMERLQRVIRLIDRVPKIS